MKIAIYGHGGSQNHGNEEIVRGIRKLFPDSEIILYSFSPEADKHFFLDEICEIRSMTANVSAFLKILRRLFKKGEKIKGLIYRRYFQPFISEISRDTIYLLEAGDQYCEKGDHRFFYGLLNKIIYEKGAKAIMMGCTVNPELLEDEKLVNDIKKYSLVVARESITYKALKNKGVERILHAPCPAFLMDTEKTDIPEWMNHKKFVSFNVGFLQQGNEKYYDIVMKNYFNAIKTIIEKTDMDIALIPHVNWSYQATDFTALDELYRFFKSTDRIHYISEHSAPEQRYLISKSTAFVSLRTHAAISGLATFTPTLIAGYKIKSKGIAKDIFGEKFDMLADVQSLGNEWVITEKLMEIIKHEPEIRDYYKTKIPVYYAEFSLVVDEINRLDGNKI